jgi:hypothetical protein
VGDRRLAVELDGDTFHGPDKWVADLHRQRALERMGWKFWRCWGSHWRGDPDGCMQELLTTLAQMGIEPIGGELSPIVYTEHRTVGATEPTHERLPGLVDLVRQDPGSIEPRVSALPLFAPERAETPPMVPLDASASARETAAADSGSDLVVEPGDTVVVRFDDNRVRRLRLSQDSHRPRDGIVHIDQPIGRALLGSGIEEEIEFVVDGQPRSAVVQEILKAA